MMDTKEFNEKQISSYQFITEEVQEKLQEFNILTLGQLLSSTKGLTKIKELFCSEEELQIVRLLKDSVPEEILKEHEQYDFTHPTGLLIRKNNDHENTNIDQAE